MHERSLIKSLIEQTLDEMQVRGLRRIHEIQIQIGEFSGVEPRLVQSAFAEMAPDYWDTDVQLNVECVPLTAKCQTCDHAFSVERFQFVCPECGSGTVEITAGEEMRLVSLQAELQSIQTNHHEKYDE